jgi:hypothetical protein
MSGRSPIVSSIPPSINKTMRRNSDYDPPHSIPLKIIFFEYEEGLNGG